MSVLQETCALHCSDASLWLLPGFRNPDQGSMVILGGRQAGAAHQGVLHQIIVPLQCVELRACAITDTRHTPVDRLMV